MMINVMYFIITYFNNMLYSQVVQAVLGITFYYLLTTVKSHSLRHIVMTIFLFDYSLR